MFTICATTMPPTPKRRQPFAGTERKLVIAFDIGTTYSGASYALLKPGEVPEIEPVTRFPAQQNVGGSAKIPSVLCYSQSGQLIAAGEEAVQYQDMQEDSDEEDDFSQVTRIVKAEWFKLHIRPELLPAGTPLPPLPRGKSAFDLFADLLGYLFTCTRTFIQEQNTLERWDILASNIEFIITHPNGWELREQLLMREAAVKAGLIPSMDEADRVKFVTEGEASLHFCVLKSALDSDVLPNGQGCIIVDAGGGTVDISAYCREGNGRATIREIATSKCLMQGSVFVTRRAEDWLRGNLDGSKYGSEDDIRGMMMIFDKTTKLSFRAASDNAYIRFGRPADKDPRFDIRSGQKKIAGNVMAGFFEPTVDEVVAAIREQMNGAQRPISRVYLVGGFGQSDYLFEALKTQLTTLDLSLSRPDANVNKAVPDGAVSFHIDHFVSSRVARLTYGTDCAVPFNLFDPEHRKRLDKAGHAIDGRTMLPGYFDAIIHKDEAVSEEREYRSTYCRRVLTRSGISDISVTILGYHGTNPNPKWMDEEEHAMSPMCTVTADMSTMSSLLTQKTSARTGRTFFEMDFDVVLLLGLTELKAQICWDENGAEKRSPARIVYEGGSSRA